MRVRVTYVSTASCVTESHPCRRQNMSLHAVRFRFDGEPVREVDTPQTMSMEDGDAIEVFQQQTGGGGRRLPRRTGAGA